MHNLVIGINFTYGWMPTIMDFRSEDFKKPLKILNSAKNGVRPTFEELIILKGVFNNSLVGASKLLHFICPEKIAIWDSRVYRYLTGYENVYNHRIGNCDTFLSYLKVCEYLTQNNEYDVIHRAICEKIGYQMTKFRTAELIMFTNGKKQH